MDKFFASIQSKDKSHPQGLDSTGASGGTADGTQKKQLPKGVVLGPDGKPCRSCMSVRDWMAMARAESDGGRKASSSASSSRAGSSSSDTSGGSVSSSKTTSSLGAAAAGAAAAAGVTTESSSDYPADCPPDVDRLGRHTWTFLHGLTAAYPPRATPTQQADMRQFLSLFSRLYPCWVCADDLQAWMRAPGNTPRVDGQESLGRWMCEAHNEVNRKLGKDEFDCQRWRERWVDGWKDGRCE